MGTMIRVVVVDDSLLIRSLLEKELNKDPSIEVVAAAADAIEAKSLILRHKPDVVTLDVEMPRMDGMTFLGILQRFHPVPVVMLSTLTAKGSAIAIEALRRGATEIMQKPGDGSFLALARVIEQLVFKIKAAAVAKRRKLPGTHTATAVPLRDPERVEKGTVVAIGASTGGTEALRYVLARLPATMPPIVIVQHMPGGFTETFAQSLDKISDLTVVEAGKTVQLRDGLAALARGGTHVTLTRRPSGYQATPHNGEPVCHQCPSVDVLFHSAAQTARHRAIGAILTGMGSDGADGMLAMRKAGAATIAQDQDSCVVFGMPKEAIACGAVGQILPLERIPQALVKAVEGKAAVAGTTR